MVTTSYILGKIEDSDGTRSIWSKFEGLAKDRKTALEIHRLLYNEKDYPELLVSLETIDWPEGDEYFPYDHTEFWILGGSLQLN